MTHKPRIALLGFSIECNRFAPVVKSHHHFRGGFDEFFHHEQIIEVDAPGLTNPVLSRFPWQYKPRPVPPIDDHAECVPSL